MNLPLAERPAPPVAPALPAPKVKVCVCGHERVAHRHYRKGTDCGLCACSRYAKRRRIFRWR